MRTDQPDAKALRAAREEAGLSARVAADLIGVTTITWQRYEGQTSRKTKIPESHAELFWIKVRAAKQVEEAFYEWFGEGNDRQAEAIAREAWVAAVEWLISGSHKERNS